MKKIISVLCIVFAITLVIGVFSVSAASADSGKIILDNDHFYAVMPEGYKYESGFSSNYYYVNENYLVACFDQEITEETITQIAKEKPYYFVMRDSGFANDSVATNFEQIFTTYSAETVRKVL